MIASERPLPGVLPFQPQRHLWALASKRLAQIVLYYQQAKMMKKIDTAKKEAELEALKAKYDKKMTTNRKMQTLRVWVCDARGCAGACLWVQMQMHARACELRSLVCARANGTRRYNVTESDIEEVQKAREAQGKARGGEKK